MGENIKAYFIRYFEELSYNLKYSKQKFKDVDELINFTLLDIITSLFHSKMNINPDRFIDNLEEILKGIKRFHSDNSKTKE